MCKVVLVEVKKIVPRYFIFIPMLYITMKELHKKNMMQELKLKANEDLT